MKSIQSMVANAQQKGFPSELTQKKVSGDAKSFIDQLLEELKATYPAWHASIKSNVEESYVKKVWVKAFMENGITNIEQVKKGLVSARRDARPFLPSVGEFMGWCSDNDETEQAYERMLAGEKPIDEVEKKVRQVFCYEFRRRASDEAGMVKFKKVYLKWQKLKNSGHWPARSLYALSNLSQTKQTDMMIEDRLHSDRPKTDLEIRMNKIRTRT